MKTRITKKLTSLKKNNQKAFIPFITAGDPDLITTEKLIYTLEKAGASIIELGMPFSDPMADGPAIQRANERSISQGTSLSRIFSLVKSVRKGTQIPILLMGYYNPIYQYGLDRFAKDCHQSGIDGLIVVDLPVEEASPLKKAIQNYPIDLIYLLSPTSDLKRIKLVAKNGSGFVYYVSFTGITGASRLDPKSVKQNIKRIRSHVQLPIQVGFGISTPEHAKQIAPLADGIVVGSALVKLIERYGASSRLFSEVENFVKRMVRAM